VQLGCNHPAMSALTPANSLTGLLLLLLPLLLMQAVRA
jgi:hypothetical protein